MAEDRTAGSDHHVHTALCNKIDELEGDSASYKQRCFKMGKERMETRKVIKSLKAQCEDGPDHKHDALCGMVEDLRARLMDTQKEKIALLEEKLCNLCEEKHPDDERHDEIKQKCADLEHSHEGMCEVIKDLRARLMKTQKEKIVLLEEKLCTLCEEKHPEDGRHEELKKKCEDLEHKHTSMCDVTKDLRARLMKTQKEKIALLEEKLCALCETEHVEDNRHEEAKKEASPSGVRQSRSRVFMGEDEEKSKSKVRKPRAARESTLDRVLNEVENNVFKYPAARQSRSRVFGPFDDE